MCGIVGYVGPQNATPILIEGLSRLEYRGYDSAGIAVISGTGQLEVRKAAGKLQNLRTALAVAEPAGQTGMGHTRWATHGRPTDINAHPHSDCGGNVTVVHNGIIENYAELRDELIAGGHSFRSETDTEVLAHLIEDALTRGETLAGAVRAALARVTGSYAIVVVSREHPDHLVAARLSGPLIVGLGKGENFLASDIPAILPHTREIIVLEEGEVADVTATSVTLTDLTGNSVSHEPMHVDWDLEAAEKGGFPHYFVKEIHEQPHALARALLTRVVEHDAKPVLRLAELEKLAASGALATIRRITILGCGSSVHAGLLGKYAIERWARIPVEVSIASEYRYADPIVGPDTLVVSISQSGETADTLAATRLARELGAPVIAVTNIVGSALTRVGDAVLYLQAGPEISVTSTKTFAATTTVLYLLALWLGQRSGALNDAELDLALRTLQQLPAQMQQMLDDIAADRTALDAAAALLADRTSCMFIGRGPGFPLALEAALKLKEISYIHAEAYPAGELKHGPIALLDPEVPLVAMTLASRTYDKVISNVEEVRAREAKVLAVATQGDAQIARHADATLYVPEAPELFAPLLALVPMQLVAYHVALARGCNIDQPRNLAKSVTVE
ncbi:MAG: Glutamine--fructose-6-phosphate aminotransferase [isomerizing] [Ktedonobacterales bacterium]|jgi:glucosamine--fructose-6-phosphate aminotransferase (isomerizing)|nr:MAG: Glutamine--fructose-6-phosphate aminotransferase [isomerizing] [Ktedonobacterales bacterium]